MIERVWRAHGYCLRGVIDGEKLVLVLRPGRSVVGASPSSELVVPGAGVSRRHAEVFVEGDLIALRDLGSKNGTWLNGDRIVTARARMGDTVAFGPASFVVEPVAAGEVSLALEVEPADQGSPHVWSWSRTTTAGDERVPSVWLASIAGLANAERCRIPEVLDVVRRALGAEAVVAIEWSRSDEVVMKEVVGHIESREALAGLLLPGCRDGATSAYREGVEVLVSKAEGRVAIGAFNRGSGGRGRGVVAWGGAVMPLGSEALLRAVWPLLRPDLEPPSHPSAARRRERRLDFPAGYLAGSSEAMAAVYLQLGSLVRGDIPVLITGETGVGKEHMARTLHLSSARLHGPFVAVSCVAIPSDLLEAELFGIEAGVATGVGKREGKLVLARGGTVFFDEVGDMSEALQAKLLRALQEREVHPVGARAPIPLDIRVVSATNADLERRMQSGRFRRDLYYRLAGSVVDVPPLRARPGDIPAMVAHFVAQSAAEAGKRVRGVSAAALEALVAAPWPGNVRQLRNEVSRLVCICPDGQHITSEMLAPALQDATLATDVAAPDLATMDLGARHDALDRALIQEALSRTAGNRSAAATMLGISRHGLRLMMRRLRIDG